MDIGSGNGYSIRYFDDWSKPHISNKYNFEKYLLLNIGLLLYKIESKEWLMNEWDWLAKSVIYTPYHSK